MPRPGSSQVLSAAASDLQMEGGIVQQQHTLVKARRKRPPEDHADHEWKRQKDSDTAGQHSSAIDEIGWELDWCIDVNIEVLKTKKLSQKKWYNFFTAESANA